MFYAQTVFLLPGDTKGTVCSLFWVKPETPLFIPPNLLSVAPIRRRSLLFSSGADKRSGARRGRHGFIFTNNLRSFFPVKNGSFPLYIFLLLISFSSTSNPHSSLDSLVSRGFIGHSALFLFASVLLWVWSSVLIFNFLSFQKSFPHRCYNFLNSNCFIVFVCVFVGLFYIHTYKMFFQEHNMIYEQLMVVKSSLESVTI